jgi:large subunit ribosomal protein L21
MFAIFQSGGKQHKVSEGSFIEVELIDAEVGSQITLNDVLAKASASGEIDINPQSSIDAIVVEHGKADKVYAFKRRRRHTYKKLKGHRQPFTKLQIIKIN